jgi:hypothetical protein
MDGFFVGKNSGEAYSTETMLQYSSYSRQPHDYTQHHGNERCGDQQGAEAEVVRKP